MDIGCGGGILSESLAKHGAITTGIDVAGEAIAIAADHAKQSSLTIDYQTTTIEDFAENHTAQFDSITCLEILEHVPDPQSIIQHAAKALKPGGWLFLSTINRNLKAYVFAILAAEYILRIIPQCTHDYDKLITPAELSCWLRNNQLTIMDISGLQYNPLTRQAYIDKDIKVNYLVACRKE